ncbi:inner nuclear membrane protein Man1 [Patella vulgata]|uniref:inner nuclear membrane protein Man1 n=1 Tax=Patella vulgata TaxID=6465 RepID=UPI0024A7E6F3|nr:inner nuclear membrane protein Man1 [Patella vulgata]
MAVDDISDKQLVEELAKYGEKITLPLKTGKREILIKKLNHFRVRERSDESPIKKSGRNRRTLDAVSSDESDSSSKEDVASGSSQTFLKSVRRRSAAASNTQSNVDDEGFKRPTPRRSRRSEPVVPMSTNKTSRSSSKLYPSSRLNDKSTGYVDSSTQSGPSTSKFNSLYDYGKSLDTSDSELEMEESLYEVENKSVNTTLPYDEDEEFESKIPIKSNTKPTTRYTSSFLNSFRKEYQFTPSTRPLPSTSRNSYRNTNNDTNTNNSQKQSKKKKYGFYPEHISEGLVAVVILFFVCLVVGYMFVKSDNFVYSLYGGVFPKAGPRSEYLLCEDEEDPTKRCYSKDEVETAMIIIHDLYDLLSTKAGEVECGNEVDKDMTSDDFKQQLKDMKHKRKTVKRLYSACTDLIIKNPHWKLRAYKDDGSDATAPDEVATLESVVASKSLVCRLGQSFYRVITGIIIFLTAILVLYFGVQLYKYRSKKSDVEQRRVFKMVEEIIDILKENCDNDSDDDTSYMAVQHVRDQLLPPQQRRELQPIWNKAVKFIEDNESRIRLETQNIQGEEFEVWRWIQTVPNGGKVWQGQAFGEHKETTTSPIRYSPTPCLKVKNMFDAAVESEEDWFEKVENAILEKTEGVADIIHMFVDENSTEGCVYLKCSSRESAGKARQCLHGWWFDGRLITARYLRLEHYHKQFPDSVKAVRPLRLRKQQDRSSLRQPYFRSTLEMT